MVVPAVRIVVKNQYSRVPPGGLLLQEVDERNQESLLIQRVGIAGMTVLKSLCLNKTYGWEIAGIDGTGGVRPSPGDLP